MPKEVLVVEDEPLVRMVAVDVLAENGIMTWEAADAEDALEVLEQHPEVGLIFTDVDMPGPKNGLDLAREVSAVRPHVGLIVTSGSVSPAAEDLPPNGTFLPKPYPPAALVQLVTRKLDE